MISTFLYVKFISFSIYSAILHVKIKKAEDLSVKSSGEVSFNFVQVELDPFSVARSAEGEYLETKRMRNSVSPVFDDLITIKILPDELKEQTLICYVYDENRMSPRDLIGVVKLEMIDVFNSIQGKEKNFDECLKWRKGVCVIFVINDSESRSLSIVALFFSGARVRMEKFLSSHSGTKKRNEYPSNHA